MNRVVLWDFHGTLADGPGWSATLADIVNRLAPGLGTSVDAIRPWMETRYPWDFPHESHTHITDADQWWEWFNPTIVAAAQQVGAATPVAQAAAAEFRRSYTDPAGFRLYDDVMPVLKRLTEQGWRHIIVSNHAPELPDIVAALGLDRWIEQTITSALAGFEKPRPELFRIALDAAGNPDTVWMVGDNYHADILGAAALDLPAVLVRREHPDATRWSPGLAGIEAFLEKPPVPGRGPR